MMKRFFSLPARALRGLRKDISGDMTTEALMTIPVMVAAMMLTFVSFTYFKVESRDAKAGLVVADAISRQIGNLTPEFMDSAFALHRHITDARNGSALRLTVVDYDPALQDYRIRWSESRATAGYGEVPGGTMAELRNVLPPLAGFETVSVVETFIEHRPLSRLAGLDPVTFHDVAVIRPRYAAQVCWTAENGRDGLADRC